MVERISGSSSLCSNELEFTVKGALVITDSPLIDGLTCRQRTATGATSPETLSDSDDEAFRVLAQEPSSASHLDVNRERVIDEVLRAFGPDTPYSTADRLAMM